MTLKLGPSGGITTTPYDGLQTPEWTIFRVNLRVGDRIDAIQLDWTDGVTQRTSRWFGNEDGGTLKHFPIDVAKGDYLVKIEGWMDIPAAPKNSPRIYTLKFHTKGGETKTFGDQTPPPYRFHYECCDGQQISGIFGYHGKELDSLGVYTEAAPKA